MMQKRESLYVFTQHTLVWGDLGLFAVMYVRMYENNHCRPSVQSNSVSKCMHLGE